MYIDEKANNVITKVIEQIKEELGIAITKKEIIPLVFADPSELTMIVIKNLEKKIAEKRIKPLN